MLGTIADAEDVVQEAFLRWHAADHDTIEKPDAWLTTVTSRIALDRLRAAKRKREDYVGPWVAEPLVLPEPGPTPEEVAVRTESLTLGFLAVLDRLAPVERAVFLLSDVFGVPFAEIAESVGKTPAACRQIAVRARERVRGGAPRLSANGDPDRKVVEELLMAVALGDVDAVVARLAPEAICVSDGGANKRAGRRPVVGPPRIARFLRAADRLVLLQLADEVGERQQVRPGAVQQQQVSCATRTAVVAEGDAHPVRAVDEPVLVHAWNPTATGYEAGMDALDLLTGDHNRVRGLFTRFKSAKESDDLATMTTLAPKILEELKVHTTIEEEIFYPELQEVNDEIKESITEGYEEHHVAKGVMEEIAAEEPNPEDWAAKVTVLIENIEHHADEEEQNLFPLVRKA